ncbi:hypothetical protein DYB30_004745 [Aphanomyces astaci]|uniref:PH domain-containing protein n=1 Tax=Aphanomyces astaci TaxID=112090 RepID=A0A397CFN0_APHAT|nr:hypothetical protein DYB30_004745 [Aphanomyces astaci]
MPAGVTARFCSRKDTSGVVMKSLVQRLSPRKASLSSKSVTGAFTSFHAHMAAEDDDVGVELLPDRVVVQKTGATAAPLRDLVFADIRGIEWNYHDGSVTFRDVADDLLLVTLASTLSHFETCLTAALAEAKLPQLPATTYVGVFAGSKQPRILQQLRPSLMPPHLRPKIPLALRRELLLADRPPSSSLPPCRDAVSLEFIRHGTMTFSHDPSSTLSPIKANPSKLVLTEMQLSIVHEGAPERILLYSSIATCAPNRLAPHPSPPSSTAPQASVIQSSPSLGVVPASVYGRPVFPSANTPFRNDITSGGGSSTSSWLKHQGPLSKTASEGFHLTQSWKKKHAMLHDSPLGAWLSYAESSWSADTSPMKKAEASSKRIDLASVLCIRPQSALPDAPPFAFDIVTLYRTWSFCASDESDHATWLHVLGAFVDRAAALVPDAPLSCDVKMVVQNGVNDPPTGGCSLGNATLTIASDGVRLTSTTTSGGDDANSKMDWYYTDIHKWSLVLQPQASLFLSCFMDSSCSKVGEFVLQTKNAAAMCQAIEFHVAKCLVKVDVLYEAATTLCYTPQATVMHNPMEHYKAEMDEEPCFLQPSLPLPPALTSDSELVRPPPPPPPYTSAFHASVQTVTLSPLLPPIQSFRRVSVVH